MKETFYFPHDYNAQDDEKVLKLMSVLGWEGYGLYWGIIEKLAASSEARLKVEDLEFIAFGMRTQCERITNVVRDYNLFIIEDGYFWSKRLISFFQEKELKSEKAKQSAKARWALEANKNANASKNDAIKERKGKERKMTESDFLTFWENYPSKKGKQVAYKAFMRLDRGLLPVILSALKAQKNCKQWREGFIPNPATWVNQQRWEDEVSMSQKDYEDEFERLGYAAFCNTYGMDKADQITTENQ